MAKRKTNWPLLGAVVGICAAPFTGGASLAMAGKVLIPTLATSAGLGFVGGKVVEAAVDNGSGDNSGLEQAQQIYNTQLEHYKTVSEERRKELERIQKEKEEIAEKIKSNDEEIDKLRAIINDPDKSNEEKDEARKKLIILEGENDDLKRRLRDIEDKMKEIEKDKPSAPTAPSIPWYNKLPKFGAYDKLLLTGVLVLIIYYLFLRENKKR